MVACTRPEPSNYKYVVKNIRLAGPKKWVAQFQGKQHGPFLTQLDAAATAAELAGCDVDDLFRRKKFRMSEVVERFQLFMQMYTSGTALPGDVEATITQSTVSRAMFEAEPATEWLSVWCKYGPYKDLLNTIFMKGSGSRVKGHGCGSKVCKTHLKAKSSRQERLWELLKGTALAAHKSKLDLSEWVQNCGRNVSHHSGFVATLMRFNMLAKAPPNLPKAKRLQLSSATEEYQLLEEPAAKTIALNALEKLCKLADAVNDAKASTSTPRSCTEWATYFNMIQEAAARA